MVLDQEADLQSAQPDADRMLNPSQRSLKRRVTSLSVMDLSQPGDRAASLMA
ncbi:protein of unknown function [Methylorubrum extorquens DM4]|uniref:Uncharacterized protein n=1 Tax=Methylorubrum extorquens (strain DSM 6343 / CIP 106787 / DM4) TaxID=661410 RepID=C7CFU3_METED|nr:protein of unknown function [Methylorubrum extorquens DM4]